MIRFLKMFFIIFVSGIIMSGCSRNNPPVFPLCRVVTQVDISCQKENMVLNRHYTQSEKMESVLLYLRLIKPLGKPENDPDTVEREIYRITVHFSDGEKRIYRQKAHRYLSVDGKPWKTIDPEQAAQLYALMQHYPSDRLI